MTWRGSGDGGGGEVLPDALVGFGGGEQHRLGVLDGAPGPADLLVVGDGRVGGAEVHAEAEVGLVVAHAEGAGGDEGLEFVVEQVPLGLEALRLLGLAGVGGDLVAPVAEVAADLVGGGDGEGVDDPRAGQLADVLAQPGDALGGGGQRDDGERLAGQGREFHLIACPASVNVHDVADITGPETFIRQVRAQHNEIKLSNHAPSLSGDRR